MSKNILLKKLVLSNFMCHDSLEVNFSDKLNLILGENGSGKSAILDALHLCFDPSFKRGDTQLAYIKSGEESSKIELYAIIDNADFYEKIVLKRAKPADRSIIYNGDSMTSAASKKFLDATKLSLKSNFAFYSQNDTSFLTMTPTQRSHYINELTQINFDNQVRHIKDLMNEEKIVRRSYDDELLKINTEISVITSKLEDNKEKLKLNENSLPDFNLEESEKDSKLLEDKLESLKKVIDNNIVSEFYKLEADISSNEKYLDRIKSIDEPAEFNGESPEYFDDLILQEEKVLNENLATVDNIKKEISEESLKESELKKNIAVFESELKKIENSLSSIGSNSTCPLCLQPITRECEGTLINEKNKYSDKVAEAYNNYNIEKDILSKKQEELRKVESEVSQSRIKIEKLKVSKNNAAEKLDNYIKEKEQYNKRQEELDSLVKQLNESKETLKKLEIKKLENEKVIKEAKDVELSLYSLREKINTFSKNIILINDLKKSIEEDEVLLKEKSVSKAQEENNIKKSEEQVEKLEDAHKLFVSYLPKMALTNIYDVITQKMNSLVHQVFPDITYNLYGTKEGVELKVCNRDTDNKSDSIKMCSGFENNLASIIFRIALLKLSNISLLILDEADSAASEENSKKLFDIVSNFDFQLIIVSHKKVESFEMENMNIVSL